MDNQIIIIGAGISGLASAYYLEQAGYTNITILEASPKAGGKIATSMEDDFLVEAGPDSFITTKPFVLDLIHELGLTDELISPKSSKFFILKNGILNDVPKGLKFMVATDKDAFMGSSLFSESGKLRALQEDIIPVKHIPEEDDESFGEFIERRFGKEMLSNYAEPLFGGIYATPAYQLSMRAAFPQFYKMEEKYGSLTNAIKNQSASNSGQMQRSPFMSLRGGIQILVNALVSGLKNTNIIYNCRVEDINNDANRYGIIASQNNYSADRLIITLPAYQSANVLENIDSELSKELNSITSSTSLILTLAYKKEDCDLPLNATGFVVASGGNTKLSASTWTSEKWKGRAPESHHLIRCFFGRNESQLSKEELVNIAQDELGKLFTVKGKPTHSWLNKYENLLPQYKVGHLQKLETIHSLLQKHPGLQLTGAYFGGVGLPDCVKQAKDLVTKFS